MATPAVFLTSIDIANRACQHVGASRITTFTDDTKQASEIASCYDKLRVSELRRNVWRFAVRRTVLRPIDVSTQEFTPPTWSSLTTYAMGAVVAYQGTIWSSTLSSNLNNVPGTAGWQIFFGTLLVQPYDPVVAYLPGDFVYYQSAWDSGTTYAINANVLYTDGNTYVSLTNGNLNNIPTATLGVDWNLVPAWSTVTTYTGGNLVAFKGIIYQAITNPQPNLSREPDTQANFWELLPNQQLAVSMSLVNANSSNPPGATWLTQNGTLAPFSILYPIGAGPVTQTFTRNVYMLPNGFLRMAPQDPKAGSVSFLGAPSGLMYDDYELEGNFFTTIENRPIALRFVADIQDVSQMDPMFCEGLGARIGLETCEAITQSGSKLGAIASAYNKFMGDARTINGIEEGPTEPPLDDYISCRL